MPVYVYERATDAPQLTATAVAMDSRRRFSKTWHVANVKNIAGVDQATLMVDRNSANIAYTFRFYVCLRLQDLDCCSTADGNGSYHGLAPSFFEDMTHCTFIKNIIRDDQATLMVHRNFADIAYTFWFYVCFVYEITTVALQLMATAVDTDSRCRFSKKWHVADKKRWQWPGSIGILHLPKFMPMRSSKTSRKTSFFAAWMLLLWCHCALFFLLSLMTAFVLTYEKIISWRPWPPLKNWDIHIEEFLL